MPEILSAHNYLRLRRPNHQRTPAHRYIGLETINTLIARPTPLPDGESDDGRVIDLRLNLATRATGEGYVPTFTPYRQEVEKRRRHHRKRMSKEEIGGFVDLVAENLAEDKYSANAITICTFAKNGQETFGNLAVSGRVGTEDLETTELGKPVVNGKEVELVDLVAKRAKLGELGRITVAEEFRGIREDGTNQTTELVEFFIDGPHGVVETAQALGCDTIVTIAKNQFVRHTRGTTLQLGEPIEFRLSPRGEAIAATYEGYWKDPENPPCLYIASIPAPKRS